MPERLGDAVRLPIDVVAPGRDVEHAFVLRPKLRGIYSLGPTVATWSDPFGLTTQTQVLNTPHEIIVHPSTEALSDRVLTRIIVTCATFSFFSLVFIALMPALARQNLGIDSKSGAYGVLFACFGLGALLGALGAAAMSRASWCAVLLGAMGFSSAITCRSM